MEIHFSFPSLSDTLARFLHAGSAFSVKPLAKAAALAGLVGLLALPQTAHAFDTGPHHDLTENAMTREGFGGTAIEVAQVNNWFTDYYSDVHPGIQDTAAKLHFDNMPNMDMSDSTHISNYWTHLSANTQTSIQKAAQLGDVLRALTILGVSLHTVQDFYSHSNWVEMHPKGPHNPYRTETWFNSQPYPMSIDLHTGHYPNQGDVFLDHGDATYGMNHDALGTDGARRHYPEAFVFAYVASQEWIKALHQWVETANPGFWARMQQYSVEGYAKSSLDEDLLATYRVSEWLPKGNGHWSGPGSTDIGAFGSFMLGYSGIQTPYENVFKDVLLSGDLTNGLTGDSPAANAPVVPAWLWSYGDRAVSVRTLSVDALTNNIDWSSQADFFASIGIAGQNYTMATQQNQDHITPNWIALKVVPYTLGSADIAYTLLDEDPLGSQEICDINPSLWDYGLNASINLLGLALNGAPETSIVTTGQVSANNRSQVQVGLSAEVLQPSTAWDWKHLQAAASPGSVVFNLKVFHNKKTDTNTVIQQHRTLDVTVHAVNAKTGLPVSAEVYCDSPQGEFQVGVTDQPFSWQFGSETDSHVVNFKVWVPGWHGYNPGSASVNVIVNTPDNFSRTPSR